MHRFEEETVVPALGAPPRAAGPEDLQHRRPILLCHPRQHGRLLPNRPAKCHRSTNVGIHSPHTQPNPSTRPSVVDLLSCVVVRHALDMTWRGDFFVTATPEGWVETSYSFDIRGKARNITCTMLSVA